MAAVRASIGEPAELDISSWRNDSIDDFEITIIDKTTKVVIDLSVYDEILMQIKNDPEETTSLLTFSKATTTILWSVDSGGTETGDGTDGKIVLRQNATAMEVLGDGDFVYDIQFTLASQGKRNTLVFGKFKVTADRTR